MVNVTPREHIVFFRGLEQRTGTNLNLQVKHMNESDEKQTSLKRMAKTFVKTSVQRSPYFFVVAYEQ